MIKFIKLILIIYFTMDNQLVHFDSDRRDRVQIAEVPDLMGLIADYCEDESLMKLSKVFKSCFKIY